MRSFRSLGKRPKSPLLFDDAGFSRNYFNKVLQIQRASMILALPLNEVSGTVIKDYSPKASNCECPAAGISYSQAGIGGRTGLGFDGNNTYINIPTVDVTFDTDWNGNLFSMISWQKINALATWDDVSTARWCSHIRCTDSTYYATFGHGQTQKQLEWRRRTGGPITSFTKVLTSPPTDWFCMGLTFDLTGPLLVGYLWTSASGFEIVGTSSSANLTDWGANLPVGGASVFYAGSITLQEWIGYGQNCFIWNTALTQEEMLRAMTP